MDTDTQIGRDLARAIVPADMDDDCATDTDMHDNAVRILERELRNGINSFLVAKSNGLEKNMVKNLDWKNRFHRSSAWKEDNWVLKLKDIGSHFC